MQPAKQQRHVLTKLVIRGIGAGAQGPIAIRARMQQDLLDIEAGCVADGSLRQAGLTDCIGERAPLVRDDIQQSIHVPREWCVTESPHARGKLQEANCQFERRFLAHVPAFTLVSNAAFKRRQLNHNTCTIPAS